MFALCLSARRRVVAGSKIPSQWGSAERLSLMTCDVLFLLACARIVASQARRVVSLRRRSVCELLRLRCIHNGIRVSAVFVLRCFAWNARASVCRSVHLARFALLHKSTFRANSLPFNWRKVSRSSCAAHVAQMQSELSAHFGWVQSLSLWRRAQIENARSAHFKNAK